MSCKAEIWLGENSEAGFNVVRSKEKFVKAFMDFEGATSWFSGTSIGSANLS